MARYSGHEEPWGSFVDAKTNLPELLEREVARRRGKVLVGTVCDPYQPVEARYRLTRRCLEILGRSELEFRVLTKSDMVLRDRDVLARARNATVTLTVTGLPPAAQRFFEPGAPSTRRRINALTRLAADGARVAAFFGPVVPHFADSEEAIDRLFEDLERAGVKRVLVDKLNYLGSKLALMRGWLTKCAPEALAEFEFARADPEGYSAVLRGRVEAAFRRHRLEGETVF
jgi:DNA repair photolyase